MIEVPEGRTAEAVIGGEVGRSAVAGPTFRWESIWDDFGIEVFGAAGASVVITGTCPTGSGRRVVYLGSNEGRIAVLTRGWVPFLKSANGIPAGCIYERTSLPSEPRLTGPGLAVREPDVGFMVVGTPAARGQLGGTHRRKGGGPARGTCAGGGNVKGAPKRPPVAIDKSTVPVVGCEPQLPAGRRLCTTFERFVGQRECASEGF